MIISFLAGFQQVSVPVVVCYGVFVVAFLLKGPILRFNQLGDFSYGLYIYAWPIQQSLVALVPGVGPMMVALSTLILTLFLAVISWFLIEKPALSLKDAKVVLRDN